MIGLIFGSYKVLERDFTKKAAARYWKIECQCCGKIKTIRSDALKRNPICKCQKDDMIGKIFGDFLVLNRTEQRAKDKCIIYECECINCKNKEYVASNVLRSKRKNCSKCHIRKSTLIDITGEVYGWLKVLERDTNPKYLGHEQDSYWFCKCLKCGTIKSIRGISLRKGMTKSCGCVKSIGEELIGQILNDNKIKYKKEYSFNDLFYKQKLRFDFAIFNDDNQLSHLIEYDGVQHFKESYWGGLEKIQLRDNLKNQYCKEHNIKLIRINKIEDITLEKLMGVD